MDKRRTYPLVGKKCLGEVFIHPTNVHVGFVQAPCDGNSQMRTPHVKDRSFIPGGVLNTFKHPMWFGKSLLIQMLQRQGSFRWITDGIESDVKDAAPESLIIDASDTDAIDVEID